MSAPRILIIDDEENIRTTMQFALEAVGYRVEKAADGPEGLDKFGKGESWDLVLLDQRMPRMEGLEVLHRIRERDPAARIVMVTAYGTIELAVDAMKAGAVDFLRKPFTAAVLRGAVEAALAHPRVLPGEAHDLTRLLPSPPGRPTDLPLIYFRTLNGYRFWPVPLAAEGLETDSLRIRRGFEILAPSRERRYCAVDVTTSVRGAVHDFTHQEHAPDHPIWDLICKSALSSYLWEKADFPPANLLVYQLTQSQLENVRLMSGVHTGRA